MKSRLAVAAPVSSAIGAALFACAGIAVDAWHGRSPRFVALVSIAVAIALVTSLCSLIQWPLLRRIRSAPRAVVIAAGALLGVLPMLMWILLLRGHDDPDSVAGYVRFWLRVPGEFLLGFMPMAAAGAALAMFATARERAKLIV
jgi:hypothetical protein